jgi:predicted ester cyclase
MAKAKTKLRSRTKLAAKKPVPKTKAPTKRATARAVAPAAISAAPGNKDIYRRFIDEVVNSGNDEVALQMLDPVVVSHSPLPEQQPGAAGFIASLAAMRKAFPDLHAFATHLVAEGDHVAARLQVSATHSGDFFGIRATGRKIHYEEQVFVRFAGGRIVEHWAVADGLSILQQLDG